MMKEFVPGEQYDVNSGPVCPYCGHLHDDGNGHYHDEAMIESECEACDKTFKVSVGNTWTWTTNQMETS